MLILRSGVVEETRFRRWFDSEIVFLLVLVFGGLKTFVCAETARELDHALCTGLTDDKLNAARG
jgi:hypothetical protein